MLERGPLVAKAKMDMMVKSRASGVYVSSTCSNYLLHYTGESPLISGEFCECNGEENLPPTVNSGPALEKSSANQGSCFEVM